MDKCSKTIFGCTIGIWVMLVIFVACDNVGARPPMSNHQRIAYNSILQCEGYEKVVYKCTAGKNTVGYGTRKCWTDKTTVTQEEAKQLVIKVLKNYDIIITKTVQVELNDTQRAALLSFMYNIGETAFRKSTLLKVLNKGEYQQVANEMKRWVYAKGKKQKGLINRRNKEIALWNK